MFGVKLCFCLGMICYFWSGLCCGLGILKCRCLLMFMVMWCIWVSVSVVFSGVIRRLLRRCCCYCLICRFVSVLGLWFVILFVVWIMLVLVWWSLLFLCSVLMSFFLWR